MPRRHGRSRDELTAAPRRRRRPDAFRSVPAVWDTQQVRPCSSHAFPTRDGPCQRVPNGKRRRRCARIVRSRRNGSARSFGSAAAKVIRYRQLAPRRASHAISSTPRGAAGPRRGQCRPSYPVGELRTAVGGVVAGRHEARRRVRAHMGSAHGDERRDSDVSAGPQQGMDSRRVAVLRACPRTARCSGRAKCSHIWHGRAAATEKRYPSIRKR